MVLRRYPRLVLAATIRHLLPLRAGCVMVTVIIWQLLLCGAEVSRAAKDTRNGTR